MASSVKYVGTFTDYSGYGQANRNFIASLFISRVAITTELVVQVNEKGNFGWVGQLANSLKNRSIPYKIKIIHLTPDMYPRYMENGKYHIGHLFWETDRLPAEWVEPCNKMNEIWTASEEQAEMIKKSGVSVPIKWFPQPIDTSLSSSTASSYVIPSFSGFVFYSIFQWIERKNPMALLKTYWKTFQGKSDVILLLKTYRVNYSPAEFNSIQDDINQWKKELSLEHYPRVFLIDKLMDANGMSKLHATGDCYINTSRGEGWCIPAVEAMMSGNPVIGVNKTGFADYLPKDTYFPCSSYPSKVTQVSWIPWYTPDQKWLEISEKDLIDKMAEAYNNRSKTKQIGKTAQQFVVDNFNYWTVGQAMKERLEAIERFV